MASQEVPHEIKSAGPFHKRASELQHADPVMSYWCNYQAAQIAMSCRPTQTESKIFLMDLLDKLEAAKAKLGSNELLTNEMAAAAYIENFALKVFTSADNEDRSGKASKQTASKFLAATNFFEVLTAFGNLDTETQNKIKYAKWKTVEITKALKEGRRPSPGPAGGMEAEYELLAAPPSEGRIDEEEARQLASELANTLDEPGRHLGSGSGGPSRKVSAESVGVIPDEEEGEASLQTPQAPSQPVFPPSHQAGPISPTAAGFPNSTSSTSQYQELGHQKFDLPTPDQPAGSHFPSSVFPPSAPSFPPPSAPIHQPTSPPPPTSQYSPQLPHSSSPPPHEPRHHQSYPLPSAPPYLPPTPQTFPSAIPSAATSPPPPPQARQGLDPKTITDAQKHAKWAISALNYEDLETARRELLEALRIIGS